MNKHTSTTISSAVTMRKRIATALTAVCLFIALSLPPIASQASNGASNRKEAISQALARSDSEARVLGVKRIKKNDGSVIFAVKVISNGRVKVINIPKVKSE